jgi:hypothetical protein
MNDDYFIIQLPRGLKVISLTIYKLCLGWYFMDFFVTPKLHAANEYVKTIK